MSEDRERISIDESEVGDLSEVLTVGEAQPRVTYSCNGPLTEMSNEEFAAFIAPMEKKLAPDDFAELNNLEAFKVVGPASFKGRAWTLIRKPNGAGIRAHCGNDLTALIESVPADSEDHDVTCPVCGTVTRVMKTAPGAIIADGQEHEATFGSQI